MNKIDDYIWFDVSRQKMSLTESWFVYSDVMYGITRWLEWELGSRTERKWAIMETNGTILSIRRAYNLGTLYKIGIKDSEIAMLFRLKFNL